MSSWENFSHRNLWQHSLWGKFQESIGRKTWRLNSEEASALIVKHDLPLGLSWLEVPRGPLFKEQKGLQAIIKEIHDLAKKEKAIFVRFSSYQALEIVFDPEAKNRRGNWKLEITQQDHHPQTSLILDLTLSETQILAQMKPKGRYNIKVAEKHKIIIEPSEDISSFHEILVKTGGRDGFGIHPESYYQKMLKALGENAQLLVAKYQGKIIAGGIFVYLEEAGIYYYGASDHEHRKYMAPYLLQWEAIKEAKRRGCKYYDFLGIAPENTPNHSWAGVTDFKKKFGGKVMDYPQAKEMVLRPFWYWIYKIRKRI